jgi:hypothetical protein
LAQMTPESSASRWQENPRLRRAPVVVCTVSGTYSGCTYHLDDQRLLDALNEGFTAKSLRMGRDFMPLIDVQAYFPTGTKVPLSSRYTSTYIRKANVFFVAERSRQPNGMATESGGKPKARRSRTKRTIAAEIHMPPYILKGKIHAEVWQGLLETLDRDERFLPLTAASIWPALANGESKFDFVAVNRDQVVYLGEPPG